MSWVSSVVLICDPDETDAISGIQQWLYAHDHAGLLNVEKQAGGFKEPECWILAGGFNYLDESAFADYVLGREWDAPLRMVLIVHGQEGPSRIYRFPDETEKAMGWR